MKSGTASSSQGVTRHTDVSGCVVDGLLIWQWPAAVPAATFQVSVSNVAIFDWGDGTKTVAMGKILSENITLSVYGATYTSYQIWEPIV